MKKLIIYHGNCADGFCAALVAHNYFKPLLRDPDYIEFKPMVHGEEPPDVTGLEVYILDFSFKRAVLEEMHAKAKSLVVIDHHKTARADLEGLDYCVFNMEKSGASLTHEYFYGPSGRKPDLVEYTEDRDLWIKKLPFTEEVTAALASYPYDFDIWNSLELENLIKEGTPLVKYRNEIIKLHVDSAYIIKFMGQLIPCCNATVLQSEIGQELAKDAPYSLSWYFDGKAGVYRYSLRSSEKGIDVSLIAKEHGGGGHYHAAGFQSAWEPTKLNEYWEKAQ